MSEDTARSLDLGQPVRLATDPLERCGYVVAIMLVPPYEALVRWREGATFEVLDNLVEVGPQAPELTEPAEPLLQASSTAAAT